MSLVSVDFSESGPLLSLPVVAPKRMISVSTEGGRTKVQINSSSLGVIQECLRKSQYLLHEKWRPTEEAPATLFGSAIHKALEVFYRGSMEERVLPDLGDLEFMAYGNSLPDESPLLVRATRAFIEKAQPLSPLPDTDKRSIPNGVWILHNYYKAFLNDPYVAYVDEMGPFVEKEFSFILHESDNLTIEYFGTIDLVVQHVQTKELMVLDHKTASMVGNDFFNRLKPCHQYCGYILGAKRAFGLNTDSLIINCLEVKARPKTSRGSPPSFPRQITTRDADDYQEFTEAVVTSVISYLSSLGSSVWPIGHVNACAMYGGCTYLAVCSAPKSLRSNVLGSKFRQEACIV